MSIYYRKIVVGKCIPLREKGGSKRADFAGSPKFGKILTLG